ncbi:hypothetical protein WAI453_007444 [Rhynchosporium graminicola]
MVPSAFFAVTSLPRLVSGKLDRKALRQLGVHLWARQTLHHADARIMRAPVTQAETLLKAMWQDVLQPTFEVSTEDNFMHLGGDSVAAMNLTVTAKRQNYTLSVADIFNNPKLVDMARCMVATRDHTADTRDPKPFALLGFPAIADTLRRRVADACDFDYAIIEDIYPATPLQEGFIALTLKQPGAYVTQELVPIAENVDLSSLKRAWEDTVWANPILRTRLVRLDDIGTMQVVLKTGVDWTETASLEAYLAHDRAVPMDFGTPLSRHAIITDRDSGKRTLVWTVQHALYDAWSMVLVFGAVNRAMSGTSIDVDPPKFSRYIKYLTELPFEESKTFWKMYLAGAKPSIFPLNFASKDRPQMNSSVEHKFEFCKPTQASFTATTLVQVAWAMLIGRHTEEEDVVMGVTLAGRNVPIDDVQRIVGPTITTIPMRTRWRREEKLLNFLNRAQDESNRMIAFQHLGLQNIASLDPETRSACDFKVLLLMQTSSDDEVARLTGNDGTSKLMGTSVAEAVADFHTYPVVIAANIQADKIELSCVHDRDIISHPDMQHMVEQFESILRQLAGADHHSAVADVNYCSLEDLSQIQQWNSYVEQPKEACIHDLLTEQVKLQPSAPAIASFDGELTYARLDLYASRLATKLASKGIKPEIVVPLLFDKSLWTVVAMLGVLKAGAAFTLLDPIFPPARLRIITDLVEAPLALVSRSHSHNLPWLESIVLDQQYIDLIVEPPTRSSANLVRPSHAAYVIFTSGSTGEPKGCIVPHKAYCSGYAGHTGAMHMGPTSRCLQFASYSYGLALVEILSTLMIGACICIISDEDRLNNPMGAINRLHVNWAFITPSLISLLEPSMIPQVKTIITAGEALSDSQVATWSRHVNLIQMYGQAECSVLTTATGRLSLGAKGLNIGKAIVGHCWVVEPSDHDILSPVGLVGELLISGPHVGREYKNRPEKTAAAFINSPRWARTDFFNIESSSRFYKTGDLVRYHSDGSLIFLGRKDSQVKLNGQRVELSDIEHNLKSLLPSQHKVAVELIQPQDSAGKGRLAAFVALGDRFDLTHEWPPISTSDALFQLIQGVPEKLGGLLPSFMVPAIYLPVRSLPLTVSGKTNRKRMRELGSMLTIAKLASFIPKANQPEETFTTVQQHLRSLWSQVLNVDENTITLHTAFQSLGGDSIIAMQVVTRMRTAGMRVTVKDLLQKKAIAAISSTVEMISNETMVLTPSTHVTTPFELSPVQRLFFALEPHGQNHYNLSFALEVTRTITKASLSTALETILDRHPQLRARFSQNSNGYWSQLISDDIDSSYELKSLRVSSDQKALAEVHKMQLSIDIQEGPLLAARIIESGGTKYLFLTAHHLVTDFVSWRVILSDLESLLSGQPLLEPPHFSFYAWTQGLMERATRRPPSLSMQNTTNAHANFWGPREISNTYGDVDVDSFVLDEDLSALLLKSSELLPFDPVDMLIASVLYSFTNLFPERSAIPFYVESHGREPWNEQIDVNSTVGWFTTYNPLEVTLEDNPDHWVGVQRVRESRLRFQDNGLENFSAISGEEAVSFPAIELMFNYAGGYQQLERSETTLKDARAFKDANLGGFGPKTRRPALFEVLSVVDEDRMKMIFMFNRLVDHQSRIRSWPSDCKKVLETMVPGLLHHSSPLIVPSSPRFPMLQIPDEVLTNFIDTTLSGMGHENVHAFEDIFPCSPLQQGLLFSRVKQADQYDIRASLQVESKSPVDPERLEQAWQRVINRHQTLRSIFVENPVGDGTSVQVVLRHTTARVYRYCSEEELAIADAEEVKSVATVLPAHALHMAQTADPRKIALRLDISHLMVDAASLLVIIGELEMAYSNALPDGPGPLYSTYVQHTLGRHVNASLAFWEKKLEDVEITNLPREANRPGTAAAEFKSTNLSSKRARDLFAFCRHHQLTPADVFRFVWSLVLRQYSEVLSPCFGSTVSDRAIPLPDIERAVGVYLNMTVTHISLENDASLISNLQHFQSTQYESLPFQDCPLSAVQHKLGLENGTRLFNTMMSINRLFSDSGVGDQELTIKSDRGQSPTEYDLSIIAVIFEGDYSINLNYWTSFMSEQYALNLARTYSSALSTLLDHPDSLVKDFNPLTDNDYLSIGECSMSSPLAVAEYCIHGMIQQQALKSPNHIAACTSDSQLTYRQLDEYSTRLAFHLVQLGLTKRSTVSILLGRSVWAAVALYAVLKSGAAFCLLDLSESSSMLEISDGKPSRDTTIQLITFPGKGFPITEFTLTIRQELLDTLRFSAAIALPPSIAADIAYISFGHISDASEPLKGHPTTHEAFCRSTLALADHIDMSSQTRTCALSPCGSSLSVTEILSTLIVGGSIFIPTQDNMVANCIDTFSANLIFITTPRLALLDPPPQSLKTVCVVGDLLGPLATKLWAPGTKLYSLYLFADTIVASFEYLASQSPPTCIGRPSGCKLWIVNPQDPGLLRPHGLVGEILVEIPSIREAQDGARKYLSSPISEPLKWRQTFSQESQCFYLTGHLGRWTSDGLLECLGDKDDRAKIHGQWINVVEVEHHLETVLTEPAKLAVQVIKSLEVEGKSHSLLVGFVEIPHSQISKSGIDFIMGNMKNIAPLVQDVRGKLSQRIPAYMMPFVFLPVSRIGYTSMGRIDRKALRRLAQYSRSQLAMFADGINEGRAPKTEKEVKLQKIWSELFQLPMLRIRANDSFVALGGDSLYSMRLVSMARQEGLLLRVKDVFRHPILSDMAIVTRTRSTNERPSSRHSEPLSLLRADSAERVSLIKHIVQKSDLPESIIRDVLPTTYLQRLCLYSSFFQSRGNLVYFHLDFTEPLDMARMQLACQVLVRHHQVLRTIFVPWNTELLQVLLAESCEPDWLAVDVAQLEDSSAAYIRDDQSRGVKFGEVHVKFLLMREGSRSRLIMRASHAQFDGFSLPAIFGDLQKAYSYEQLDLRTPFSNFIYNTHSLLNDKSKQSWRDYLAGSRMTGIILHTKPSYRYPLSSRIERYVPLAKATLDSKSYSLSNVLKLAWALTLAKFTGKDDVVFGYTLANRNMDLEGIADMVGPCINIVPVRLQINDSTYEELLYKLQTDQIRLLPYESMSFDDILHHCTDWPAWTRFSTSLTHQETPFSLGAEQNPDLEFGDLNCHLSWTASSFDVADIAVETLPMGDRVKISMGYCNDILPMTIVERLLTYMSSMTEILITEIDSTIELDGTGLAKGIDIPVRLGSQDSPQSYACSPLSESAEYNIVLSAWKKIMPSTIGGSSGSHLGTYHSSSISMFELGANLGTAVHLADFYQEAGFSIFAEEIIDSPSIAEQTDLLKQLQVRIL